MDDIFERINTDPIFALLYPACAVSGLDTDEVIREIRTVAKVANASVLEIALARRQQMVEQMNGIKRTSD